MVTCVLCSRPIGLDEPWRYHGLVAVHDACCVFGAMDDGIVVTGEDDYYEREPEWQPAPWGLVALAGGSFAVQCQVCQAQDLPSKWTVWGWAEGAQRGLVAHAASHGDPIAAVAR